MAKIVLPPLRDRREDVFVIAQTLRAREGDELSPEDCEVEAVEQLLLAPWPDNVRGLAAAVSRARSRERRPGLRRWSIDEVLGVADRPSSAQILTEQNVNHALEVCDGNTSRAAEMLGVSRSRLRRFREKLEA
jgi:two-component system NtrC family response regulator